MSSDRDPEQDFDAWWRDALCGEVGSDLFFVGKGQSVVEAKKVCAMCPVRVKCLADALENDVEYGVFGGMARPQRIGVRLAIGPNRDALAVAEAAIEREKKRRPRATWR